MAQKVELLLAEFEHEIQQKRAAFQAALTEARLLSRTEAAELLAASRSQIDHWTRSGVLPCVDLDRRPRYRLSDLTAFASSRLRRSGNENRQNMKTRSVS